LALTSPKKGLLSGNTTIAKIRLAVPLVDIAVVITEIIERRREEDVEK
jgi:hypothetical protein